ncbi:MAG: hypothetical protein K2H49_05925 [Muribaculaceae bacterium]|nr:hypothetical protein [Muribaculaceae bacterium]
MKCPTFFILSILLLSILLANCTESIGAINYDSEYPLGYISCPSIDSIHQDYIYYASGHHGYNWSKICHDSTGWHLTNGTTRNLPDKKMFQSFDTINLIEANIKTIQWGIDSLWKEAKQLRPSYREIYNPFFKELNIIRHNDTVFSLGNAEKFLGKDSDLFNFKLQKLMFLMLWLASPSIREYLPTPNDTIQPK